MDSDRQTIAFKKSAPKNSADFTPKTQSVRITLFGKMKKHAAIKYIFSLIWLAIGPNLVCQMWRGGLDLLHPLNATFVALVAIGITTVFFGPISRLISAGAGVILACLSIYFYWDICFSRLDDQTTVSTNFWGIEVANRSAQFLISGQMAILLFSSFLAAFLTAAQLDKKDAPT